MRRLLTMCFFLLVALAASAQPPQWLFNSPSTIIFDPTVGSDGSVYYATSDAKLNALRPTGVLAWSVDPGAQVVTPIALQGNILYCGVASHQLRAYSTGGGLAWKVDLGVNILTPLAVSANNQIFFGTVDGDIYCVDGNAAAVKWHWHAANVVGPPSIGHDGTVYFAADVFLHAADPKTGAIKWRKNCFNFSSVPIVLDQYDNLVYIRRGIMDVYDYHGNIRWEAYDDTGTLILVQGVPPVVYGNLLIAAVKGGGDFYAFDSSTGAIAWNFTTANANNPVTWTPKAVSSVAVDANGLVSYCDTTVGQIAWFDANTGYFYGFMPSNGMGFNVALVGIGLDGYGVIRSGKGAKTLVNYKLPAGPGGPWGQAGGNARQLNRRDDPPAIDLVEPADGQTVSGTLRVNANASDDFGLNSLSIYINGNLVDKVNGGTIGWLTDSSTFQDGDYAVTILAKDSAGNQSTQTATVYVTNPPPTYTMGSSPPVFSWLSNGVDKKYLVTISTDPGFASVVVSSSKQGHKWLKATAWQPSSKQWGAVIARAASSPGNPVTFYWRAIGKSGGTVITKSFMITK